MFEITRGLPAQRPPRGMHVIPFANSHHYAVVVCPIKEEWVSTFLHYDSTIPPHGKRVPCVGADCRCKGRGTGWSREQRVYVPVRYIQCTNLMSGVPTRPTSCAPALGCVGVTENSLDMLYSEHDGLTWWMRRRGAKRNGPIDSQPMGWDLPVDEWRKGYPVLDTLQRLFGARV